ncbi:hypothetical protein KIL84_012007, partial [Mauremys mutica]
WVSVFCVWAGISTCPVAGWCSSFLEVESLVDLYNRYCILEKKRMNLKFLDHKV